MDKKYIEHKSSIFNINSLHLSILIYVIPIVINFFPTVNYMGWIFPILIFYNEKSSPFIKFHSLNSLIIELFRVCVGLLLVILAVYFKMPIYTINSEGLAFINALGYLHIIFIGVTFYFSIHSVIKCINYKEVNLFLLSYFSSKYLKNDIVYNSRKFLISK